jgi:hypothetical protein
MARHDRQQEFEAEILDWIEGDLSPEREPALLAALAADPVLGRRVHAMRADREVLLRLPEERAPEALLSGVEDALERRMLMGESDGVQDTPSYARVSSVKSPGVLARIVSSRSARRLALAASVLLAVGFASWWGAERLSREVHEFGPMEPYARGTADAGETTSPLEGAGSGEPIDGRRRAGRPRFRPAGRSGRHAWRRRFDRCDAGRGADPRRACRGTCSRGTIEDHGIGRR